jgi:hypothetical protein
MESSFFSLYDFVPLAMIIIAVIALMAIVVFFALLVLRSLFHRHKIYPAIFEKQVFMLTVPQHRLDKEDAQQEIKQILATVESLYGTLGGLRVHKGFKAWLFGRFDHWSFEIVVGVDGLITFYIAVPQYLVNYIQQQFLSAYPHCHIELVPDYNIFSPQSYVAIGYLKLIKHHMFPILSYQNAKSDPLSAVLSVLAKTPPQTTVSIQIVMRSANSSWRRFGVKVASQMQQGKDLKKAMRTASANPLLTMLGKPTDWLGTNKPKDPMKTPEAYRLSPMEDQMIKSIEEKAAKAGLDTNIRLVVCGPNEAQSKDHLRQITNTYSQYSNYEYANSFKAVIKGSGRQLIHDFIYRNFDQSISCVLNTEELASLWHLPLPEVEIPRLRWLQARRLEPPLNMPTEGIILGENVYRGIATPVHIKDRDRQRHAYIIGMTGVGKSYLMANLAIQDIRAGKGVCVVDPHGSTIDDILPYIPKERLKDVIIFDPADMERPVGLNMLEATTPHEMDFAAQEMITIFYKLLPDPAMAGPMFEHYMRNALLALMADPDDPGTLVELARIFTDEGFRRKKLAHVKDILVRDFWEREYVASQKGSNGADMLSYVISKTGRFVENEMMRNIIGQPHSGFNFRQIMDEGKILLMNLSKGRIGETNSNLLGLIAVSKLQMAALARADVPEDQRRDFYLYIDEFQNFITDSISTILAEARKYKLNLVMAHQYIAQLTQNGETRVRDAVFGNVGTLISFRIGVDDSEVIAKQLAPRIGEYDLLNLERFNAYVRLLIDNTASETFNMRCFPLPTDPQPDLVANMRELSRLTYGRPRNLVVQEIIERSKIGQLGRPPMPPPPVRPPGV